MNITWNGDQFSKMVKQKRLIEDNIDMRTLSKEIDVSPATISRCENGKMPDLSSYAKLCYYIGAPMDSFFSLEKSKKKRSNG